MQPKAAFEPERVAPTTGVAPFAWRQFLAITLGAVALYGGLRLLPTGTNLSHMDFRVDARKMASVEFCDPLNPQFISVVAARSPVVMEVSTSRPARSGETVEGVVRLATASGKPVGREDLLVTHTRRLHLLVVDPSLSDYQHLHPEAGARPGEWVFAFQPRRSGIYRVFADFTPIATGRGLYAHADLTVELSPSVEKAPGELNRAVGPLREAGGHRFRLESTPQPARANAVVELRFTIDRVDGGPVALTPVMGAYAHLVAFDADRSGFAHLHPVEDAAVKPADERAPALNFKLTIPRPGSYTVWAQVGLGSREEFVSFPLEVRD